MRKWKNPKNAGMTLLEVIIAVSIFAIAAAVLLQGFVTAGRTNKKSNLYLEATSVAQNVMEDIKSKDFQEVALEYNYPLDGIKSRIAFLQGSAGEINTEGGMVIKEVILNDGSFENVRSYETAGKKEEVTASVYSEDGGRTFEFLPRTKGSSASKYYFQIQNLNFSKETFDVLISFDGSEDSGYKKKENDSTQEEQKNDYEVPNIEKLDTKENAFFIMPKDWDKGALNEMISDQYKLAFQQYNDDLRDWNEKYENEDGEITVPFPYNAPQELDYEDLSANTSRSLTISVTKDAGIVKTKIKYTLSAYNYEKSSPYETMKLCPCGGACTGENGCFCTENTMDATFYTSEPNTDLRNIYLFYYPNYNSTSRSKPLDEIILNNAENIPLNFYVTKQREEGKYPDISDEQAYRMNLKILEDPSQNDNPNWNTNLNIFQAQTMLRTNLDTNIGVQLEDRLPASQMSLTYEDVSRKLSVSDANARKVLKLNGLDARQAKDRIYEVSVKVYKHQEDSQKMYQDEDFVLELTGSKED